ncbi:MAG: hypothetical protein BGP06_14340 [Rhizobiales bacterium 65-9]|nr:porin [Hyphomicrobiales bacterium]OJY36849.1 MAG: hypothetical protein BGP06_14340 [Rhizobiales bacterium 65-9]
MKLVKSLLLGSAAGFVAMTGASAADLPSRKAAPAEYVRVCSAYGAGFFYIPGSDVCLKVGGAAIFQYAYTEPAAHDASPLGMRALGRVELDARNPTAYGTLRAFVRVNFLYRTGAEFSGSGPRQAIQMNSTAAADSGVAGRASTQVVLDKAFIQWGGLIAGRTNSLFAYNKNPEIIGVLPTDALFGTNMIGYIATFGGGFYASISAEDPIARRQAVANAGDLRMVAPNGLSINGFANNVSVAGAITDANPAGSTQFYAGARMPDIVGAIGVEQSWGGAQVSAAVHQIPTSYASGFSADSKYGWAVAGGVQINLPMLAPGDYIWLNAAYADGAMSYVHSNWSAAYLNNNAVKNSVAFYTADAYVNPVTGGISKSKTWAINAAMVHYWTPTLRSNFFGGYTEFDNPGNLADFRYWAVGTGLWWTPVRALDMGVDVAYQKIEAKGGGIVVQTTGVRNGQLSKSGDGAWLARFRITRAF